MSTFRPTRKATMPTRIDFGMVLRDMGSDAVKIREAVAYEEKTRRPFKIKDPQYWLYIEVEWVIAFQDKGEWEFKRCRGNFFDEVRGLPTWIKAVHVFRSDGLHVRYYSRVYDFFKTGEFPITSFSKSDCETLWKELKRAIRQKVAA